MHTSAKWDTVDAAIERRGLSTVYDLGSDSITGPVGASAAVEMRYVGGHSWRKTRGNLATRWVRGYECTGPSRTAHRGAPSDESQTSHSSYNLNAADQWAPDPGPAKDQSAKSGKLLQCLVECDIFSVTPAHS